MNAVLSALGFSVFAEELKGDFAVARREAEALRAAAATPEETADAITATAMIGVLQGEPAAADGLADRVASLAPSDDVRRLRALSCELLATFERYNTYPDGSGVGATDVSARWSGQDLTSIDAEWHRVLNACPDPVARFDAWLVYAFLCQLQPLRYMLETVRHAPLTMSRDEMLVAALASPNQLRDMATAGGLPRLAAFGDWAAADMHRRAGDLPQAHALLDRARDTYAQAGDRAGEGVCALARADWDAAPFSSPLAWNFALVDSSSAGSHLAQQVEDLESSGGTHASYDDAERCFREAGAERGLAAVRLRRGYLAMLGERWAEAGRHASDAREMFAHCGDRRGEHLAATHLVMCQLSGAGLPDVDVTSLARAIGAWGAASGSFSVTLGLGTLINRLGRHWLIRRGNFTRALACAQAARRLFDALGAQANATQCMVDAGAIHQTIGERRLALAFFRQALDEYGTLVETWPRVAENLRARAIFLAVDLYQLALQQCDSDGMERAADRLRLEMPAIEFEPQRQMAESLVTHASVLAPMYRSRVAHAQGQPDEAARQIELAIAALSVAPTADRAFLEANLYAETRDYDRAADAIRRHLQAGGANAGFLGTLTEEMKATGGAHGVAQAALQERRTHEQAFSGFVMAHAYREAHEHLLALERLAGPEWWRTDIKPWIALSDAAQMYEGLGRMEEALGSYDEAIRELEARRTTLGRDDLKVALASDRGAQYLYFLAARAALRAQDVARGFAYAERGKARALLDLMAATHVAAPVAEPPAARAWRESSMQLLVHRRRLAHERSQPSPDAAGIDAIAIEVAASEQRLTDAEQALARVNPQFHDAIDPTAPILSMEAVARSLPAGTALLEYFFLGDDLLAWRIDGTAPDPTPDAGGSARRADSDVGVAHYADVDAAHVNRTIRLFHHACQEGLPYEGLAAQLSEILLAPFAGAIRAASALVIVPHGAAHALPFHALPFDGAPLAAQRTVTYLPSASTLQFMGQRDAGPFPDRVLVIGNPTLDLPAARAEAEFVARQFAGPLLLLEEEATEEAVRRHIAHYPVVHLATHGRLDEESPLNSSLALANGDQLTVYELMILRLQARLVVLSACSTAQGEMTGGDDVVGLTRGLLAAGARSAVVSLWEVDDDSTALFMEAFYRELRGGAAPAAALRTAQLHLRGMIAEGYDHPYHWAPFVLVG